MASARPVRPGFFPLDDELALLPGRLTPRLLEELVHLAIWMPFARAAQQLKRSTRVELSEPTVRRQTQAAGAAYVALQTAQAEHILRHGPPEPCAPERLVLSADGAMVPLRRGEWSEVKTLVIGESGAAGEVEHLSYFSRLTDAATFGEAAVVETHSRGVAVAKEVAAVVDGAEWLQGFLDLHCPSAVRILDFPHALEHLNKVGQAVFGAGTAEASTWLAAQRHALRHEGPDEVMRTLTSLLLTAGEAVAGQETSEAAPDPEQKERAPGQEDVEYLSKRVGQMQYPAYEAAGWPLGSGVVESANKVVVEARLKGAGMRWERSNVNPMLALRNIVYSDRWDEAWAQIGSELREQERKRRRERREARRSAAQVPAAACGDRLPTPREAEMLAAPAAPAAHAPFPAIRQEKGRPAADHPWRRPWSKRQQAHQVPAA
ncbi:MAG: ISKra4 family transposase [Chloroflexota bacterium]|nr:ISKra4 family transposase [Chloroflexota bacterium]